MSMLRPRVSPPRLRTAHRKLAGVDALRHRIRVEATTVEFATAPLRCSIHQTERS